MTGSFAQTGMRVSRRGGSTVEGRAAAKYETSIGLTMTKDAGVMGSWYRQRFVAGISKIRRTSHQCAGLVKKLWLWWVVGARRTSRVCSDW